MIHVIFEAFLRADSTSQSWKFFRNASLVCIATAIALSGIETAAAQSGTAQPIVSGPVIPGQVISGDIISGPAITSDPVNLGVPVEVYPGVAPQSSPVPMETGVIGTINPSHQ